MQVEASCDAGQPVSTIEEEMKITSNSSDNDTPATGTESVAEIFKQRLAN